VLTFDYLSQTELFVVYPFCLKAQNLLDDPRDDAHGLFASLLLLASSPLQKAAE
jgi:hypothetical protein